MSIPSPFEVKQEQRQQHLKQRPEPTVAETSSTPGRSAGVGLPPPRPKRKQCSVYIDVDMMDRVKLVAHQRDVTIGAVIEACIKIALEQLEG